MFHVKHMPDNTVYPHPGFHYLAFFGTLILMENTIKSETLSVKGMSCEHCVRAVNNALAAIAGITDVKVNLKDGKVSFSRDSALAPLETIVATITDEGYEVEILQ